MADRTPAAWRDLLEKRLHARWDEWSRYDAYYEGANYSARWLRQVQRAFSGTVLGNLLRELQNNYMQLVVDAAAERLRVQGFRFGDDEELRKQAWAIWKANDLDAQSNMVHTEAVKLGEAAWMVTPTDDLPLITAEHPSQVIVATAPGNRRVRLAALKKWRDDDGYTYANVYLPDAVHKYRSKHDDRILDDNRGQWDGIGSVPNPLGEVPVIPMPNNPSMLKGGRSDLSFGATSLQDQLVKTVADLLIGAEYHGLPQRVLLGVEAPRDENGRPIPFEQAAKSRLWYFNSKDAKAHEFSQADLKGLREAADGTIGDLAAQTRIPIYYFRPQAISNISAEALIGLDAGLVSKTNDKKPPLGGGHLETIRLALKAMGREDIPTGEVGWADTESRSQAQVVDAAVKLETIGVPREALWARVGATPEQVAEWKQIEATNQLLSDAAEPAVPAAH